MPAITDVLNPPLTLEESANYSNSTFIDDNGILALQSDMQAALHQSLLSTFLIFGMSGDDHHGACLQAEKWEPEISHIMLYLGFIINSRTLTVSRPLYKREELYNQLLALLQLPSSKRFMPPKQTTSVLGKLCSTIQISPWGVYLSFSLANNLKRAGKNVKRSTCSWWSKGKICLNKSALNDIHLLLKTLRAPEEDPFWTHSIALLVPRVTTHWLKSDASYAGIGGWTQDFGTFIRHVTRKDLIAFGFNMKTICPASDKPIAPDVKGLHINPLEFLMVIINLWLALKVISGGSIFLTGYILDLLSDNTTALSWTHVTPTTPNPDLQQFAHFASTFLSRLLAY